MQDKIFKGLQHQVGKGNKIASTGKDVSKRYKPDVTVEDAKGYKPDITVEDAKGNLLYILECEQKTDRKAFLGDFIKAEHHAEHNKQNPELIIVMREEGNTTTKQIFEHLRPYIKWLKSKGDGQHGLSAVQVLSDKDYKQSILDEETLGSEAFKKLGHII